MWEETYFVSVCNLKPRAFRGLLIVINVESPSALALGAFELFTKAQVLPIAGAASLNFNGSCLTPTPSVTLCLLMV